ncbi:MAG: type II toxin-antitoxin system RelE/ParE family toxin [Myxococcales bacterium]|nr:type II toxin-antitoxin system RelE/ParE family toxin [Myxococcales bacterium]MDD9966976.1 type II toxin-antitoxin system RelE/ParE family toxin [Myxococcales bacterium]
MTVHYTSVAEQALLEIANYTLQEWGSEQCERYMSLLEAACEEWIPANANLARPVPERPQLRMLRCEHHMTYFRVVDDGFEIVHLLHERMLPQRHL